MYGYRFNQETADKLTELAFTEAVTHKKQVSNAQMLIRLIDRAFKRIKK